MSATEIQYPIGARARETIVPVMDKEVLLVPKKEAEVEAPARVLDDPSSLYLTSKERTSREYDSSRQAQAVKVEMDEDLNDMPDSGHNKGTQNVKIEMEDNDIDVPAQEVKAETEDGVIVIDLSDDLPMQNPRRSTRKKNARRYELKGRDNSKIIASRARKASIEFTSIYPFFKLVVERDHLQFNCVNIPYDFVLRNLVGKKKTLILKVVGKGTWAVNFHRYPSNRSGRLSLGWLQFANANSLSLGDVCVFELISSNVLEVTIVRGGGSLSS